MKFLYKTTLLITMAVVTWKVIKIEKNTRKTTISFTNKSNLDTNRHFGFLDKISSVFKRH